MTSANYLYHLPYQHYRIRYSRYAYDKGTIPAPNSPGHGSIMFMFCHWRYGYISAAPDDLDLFITILTMYLAVNAKVKNKQLWCSLGITLAFYTKQYFLVIAAGIFFIFLPEASRTKLLRKEAVTAYTVTTVKCRIGPSIKNSPSPSVLPTEITELALRIL